MDIHNWKGDIQMTIEQMIQRKNELGLTYEQIASLSGIPIGTVQKVLGGITSSPRYDTIMALEKVFVPDDTNNLIMEDSVVYGSNTVKKDDSSNFLSKKPGEFTLDDYYALPDDQRVELIDGVFYDMSSPTTIHQIIISKLFNTIYNFIDSNKGTCIPFTSPCDVQLDMDDKTMVQPDIMIICDRDKIVRQKIYGAPDFIIEILSPSTKNKDMFIKAAKYVNAGVKEYWIVDPDKLKVLVYDYAHDCEVSIYGFNDVVPVGLYDGKLEIDFKPIYDSISFLL